MKSRDTTPPSYHVCGTSAVAGWSNSATSALLSVWGEQNIQDQLDGVMRNRIVYEKVSASLLEMGYHFTRKQCRTKVKNLIQSYQKVSCALAGIHKSGKLM